MLPGKLVAHLLLRHAQGGPVVGEAEWRPPCLRQPVSKFRSARQYDRLIWQATWCAQGAQHALHPCATGAMCAARCAHITRRLSMIDYRLGLLVYSWDAGQVRKRTATCSSIFRGRSESHNSMMVDRGLLRSRKSSHPT
jgi:hypothetical protein